MRRESVWSSTTKIKNRETLNEDIKTEVAIIGGGITGILAAYYLKEKGKDCIILEADRIGSGQTENTTAKVTSQHNLIYHQISEKIGAVQAYKYGKANQRAIDLYEEIIKKYGIECGWERCPSYLYTTKDDTELKEEYNVVRKAGLPASMTSETELPFDITCAIRFEEQARFNPLQFLEFLSRNMKIYEKTVVREIKEDRILVTDEGNVTAEQIIFACHYPFVKTPGYYFMRMHQERSYCIAAEGIPTLNGIYKEAGEGGLSFRSYEGLCLIGGSGHRTGKNKPGDKYENLKGKLLEYWPQAREVSRWSAQDCITLDKIPYIGRFSNATPNWYVATGYGKWGMTTAMVAASLISDLICGITNEFEDTFAPERFHLQASLKNFLKDGMEASSALLKRVFQVPKEMIEDIQEGEAKVIEYENKKIGIYKEPDGQFHAVTVKCPHLGCQLAWNADDRSWDCPCHGSRFDYYGNCIDEPAKNGIKIEIYSK